MPETRYKKSDDFNEWYNEIVELADLCDKRYPIKGMNVWRPYGWKLMQHVDTLIRKEMQHTDHVEVCFPLCIPESLFQKEADHIEGFGSEVYWITQAGHTNLEERWLLRPTSETAMYPIFSLWVRAHTDLPLKTFQIVNTFRYEKRNRHEHLSGFVKSTFSKPIPAMSILRMLNDKSQRIKLLLIV